MRAFCNICVDFHVENTVKLHISVICLIKWLLQNELMQSERGKKIHITFARIVLKHVNLAIF